MAFLVLSQGILKLPYLLNKLLKPCRKNIEGIFQKLCFDQNGKIFRLIFELRLAVLSVWKTI